MTNKEASRKALAAQIRQSAEIDRLKDLAIAHLKLKGTITPKGLCRALGRSPHHNRGNTIESLPAAVRHTLAALEQEQRIKVERIDRHVTRITLVGVDHG
jgi:hypothetical protein